jgi:hypothetical protein
MKLRPIGNSNDYYSPEESQKVAIRRGLIAVVIVILIIVGVTIWSKSW